MAEVVTEIPAHAGIGRKKSSYASYLDGQLWKLTRKDFGTKSLVSVGNAIRSAARHRGLNVKVCGIHGSANEARGEIYIQAYPKEEND